jgi:NADPH:quinone reductase-like Zn-dependent oxidoreductase
VVQIADAAGTHVVTTATPENHDRVQELGADIVLDYARDDLADAILEASGGGVDVILDHRLDEYLDLDAKVANMHANVMGIGEAAMDPPVAAVDRRSIAANTRPTFGPPPAYSRPTSSRVAERGSFRSR